jgi:hypothetical protein
MAVQMLNRIGKIVHYLIIILCCSGCASVYVPSLRNVPLFSKRGQFQGSSSIGNGANVNASYALTNHIAVSAGGLYANNRLLLKNDWRIHRSAEFAGGIYGVKKRLSFELFGGYGIGKGHGEEIISGLFLFDDHQQKVKAKYKKYFIQPSAGFTIRRFQLIWTVRVSYLDFRSVSITAGDYVTFIPERSLYFLEPSFSGKFSPLKTRSSMFVFAQVGFNIVANDNTDLDFRYSILHYNIGVGININKR